MCVFKFESTSRLRWLLCGAALRFDEAFAIHVITNSVKSKLERTRTIKTAQPEKREQIPW